MFEMEGEVMASGLDVTVLRAPILHDGPITGRYRVLEEENYLDKLQIARADVAYFLLGEMTANAWVNRVIAIAE
jgi:hypothetical protein